MNDITTDDIRYIAGLSKLELSDDEIAKFRDELAEIVGYVERLQDADLDGVATTAQVSGLVDRTRPDEAIDPSKADNSLQRTTRQELLANAADTTSEGYIKVDKVL